VNLAVVAAVFPLVFLGELPDKTMFASLLLATRGRPIAVWAGAVAAFAVHVVIAVFVGVAIFKLLPHTAVQVVVAAMFLAGAVYAYLARQEEVPGSLRRSGAGRSAVVTSAAVIFVAEWGDLTQVLTANLAARYHDALSVGLSAFAALAVVAAIAVAAGSKILRFVSVRALRLCTVVVLVALAAYTLVDTFA
jgi:putative Ca2+/H+ antiporter (TMEM165/GDT1 family)